MSYLELAKKALEDRKKEKTDAIDPVIDFKTRNLAVRIRSEVLGEDIWLASNEQVRDHLKAEGVAVYLADEILHLKGLSPEALRRIHEVKKVFEGSRVVKTSETGVPKISDPVSGTGFDRAEDGRPREDIRS